MELKRHLRTTLYCYKLNSLETKRSQNMKNSSKSKRRSVVSIFAVALAVLSMSLFSACGGSDSKSSDGGDSGAKTVKADVSLKDSETGAMSVDLGDLKVKSGETVILNVTNDGTQVHNLSVDGGESTADLASFSSGELNLGKLTEDAVVHCTIQGHREAGMEATIVVE